MCRHLTLKLNKQGSFLVEALLAIVVLSVGLTLITQSFLSSFRASVQSTDYSTAMLLLDNKMHDLMLRGFIEDGLNEDAAFPEPYQKFHYHLETRNMKESGGLAFLNEAKLNVSWFSGKRINNIPVVTYLLNLPE